MDTKVLTFNLCACIALVTLILALFIRKTAKGRTNMLFMLLTMSVLASGIFDIINCMYNYGFFPCTQANLPVRYFFSYAYFLVRNASAPIYMLYICSYLGIWHKINRPSAIFFLTVIPYAIDVLVLASNFFLGMTFSYDYRLQYTRGPLLYVLYAIAFYYLIFCNIALAKYKKLSPKGKYFFLTFFLPVNALSVIIQMVVPSLRIEIIVSTAFLLSMTLEVQRPEDMIDYVVGTSSYNAFLTEMRRNALSETPFSLLLIKLVNQETLRYSLGLTVYSEILKDICSRLNSIKRSMGLFSDIYYLDRGVFAIVAPPKMKEQIENMGHLISSFMLEPINLDQMEVMLDARICLLNSPDDLSGEASIMNFANSFHKKLPKSNKLITFASMTETRDFNMKVDMDAIINRGIENKSFEMYYQPIYSCEKKKFVSAEALIRLKDEQYGFVPPGLFIPEAEENGAIHQIGDFVLEDVIRFVSETDFDALGLEYIEINLSVAQCIEHNLCEKIDALLKKYNVDASKINLEITETSVDYDPVTTDRNINALSQRGLTFSLDDYGTGYSNISRVVTLPLNIVKLDKSLVDAMDSPMMWTVIKNTSQMLKRMNKKILAEGIEDQRTLDRFIDLGIDYVQGYYFSKPLPKLDYLRFVKEKNQEVAQ